MWQVAIIFVAFAVWHIAWLGKLHIHQAGRQFIIAFRELTPRSVAYWSRVGQPKSSSITRKQVASWLLAQAEVSTCDCLLFNGLQGLNK